ncbi:MAG: ABC transporter permease [Planctomycetota bacterium]
MHSIWAVATNTIKQALRMKIAIVFIVLLVILLPLMGVSITGDETLKGRLQTFVSYGLSLTSFLLCLLTIIISIYSLTTDIKQKQIYTVVTKPIRRFELLLGKLLGIVLLDAALLVLFSGIIYGITLYMPKHFNAAKAERLEVSNEFFTARAGLKPPEVNVRREVDERYEQLKKSGQLDKALRNLSYKRIISDLTKQEQLKKRAVAVRKYLDWEFNNVRLFDDPNSSFFIRYWYDVSVNPPDLQVHGLWIVGDLRQIRYGTRSRTPPERLESKDLIRTFREIEIPGYLVAEDGYLGVRFVNPPVNSTVVMFPLEKGLEVLYKADTFTANFLRAVLLILFRLIFLACLGVMTSTFLSFPVAILLCLVIFLTATVSGFVIDSFYYVSEGISGVYSYAVKPIVQLLPQFDKFNPTKYLVAGRLLSWWFLAKALGLLICIKGALLMLLGVLIFGYKEIAKIVV